MSFSRAKPRNKSIRAATIIAVRDTLKHVQGCIIMRLYLLENMYECCLYTAGSLAQC